MGGISSLAVKRPVTTAMLVMIVVVLGLVSVTRLPIDLFPDIEIPVAIISTTYSNVAPEEIETLVTKPIEESVGTVSDIDSIQSITREGSSMVVLQFNYGTDMDFATQDVREKIDLIKGYLPSGASDPIVMQLDINATAIVQLSISGGDLTTLQSYAEDTIEPQLERIDGVASVDVSGGYENYVSVKVDPQKMNGYGLTISTVASYLAAENISLPSGSVYKGDKEFLIKTDGEFESIDEIQNLPITTPTGANIRLSDFADVELKAKDMDSITKVDGDSAVTIAIQKQSGTNTVEVASQVLNEVEKLNANSSYKINVILDQSDYIKRSIGQVAQNAIIGGILAIFILFVFLRNIRSTLIIGVTIPVSVIATGLLLYFADITLNMMTLGGLTLGIGMLVDNSVVVLENIYRYGQEGHSKKEAAVLGAKEVAMAVTASTLTTIAVFLPMVFVQGLTSILFREFSLTIAFSLISSLVVSLTLIPMMASKYMVVDMEMGHHHHRRFRLLNKLLDGTDSFYSRLEARYRGVLAWALGHRRSVVAIAAGVFIASLISMLFIGREFFPESDEGEFSIDIELEPGAQVEDTAKALDTVVETIQDIPELDYLYSTTAGNTLLGNDSNSGTINGVLVDLSERSRSVWEVVEEVNQKIAQIPGIDASASVTSSMSISSSGSDISIDIKGDDMDTLKEISDSIIEHIRKVPGIRNLGTTAEEPIPQVEITLKNDQASRYGLTSAQVSTALSNMLDGTTATEYKVDGDELDVIIEGDNVYGKSIENLKQMKIATSTGLMIPLEMVANVEMITSPVTIYRDNQSRNVTVSADIYERSLSQIMKEVRAQVDTIDIPSGYEIEYTGENEEMVDAFSDLGLALILAILLVYMIIASQFESFLMPFVIMLSTPLAFAGGLLGLFFTNRTLNITSIIGFIMLSGIVVNNAIVLIDYINTRRERGEKRNEAILNAGPIRLRPIMMTSLTTILALIPLALGIGDGAELQASMGTVVIVGLLLSSLLTLIFIPVVYTIVDDWHMKFKNKRETKSRERAEKQKLALEERLREEESKNS